MGKRPRQVHSDIDWSNELATIAVENGWSIKRQTTRYFTAERRREGCVEQIGVAIRAGELTASRIEVLESTRYADEAIAWMEGTP